MDVSNVFANVPEGESLGVLFRVVGAFHSMHMRDIGIDQRDCFWGSCPLD